MSGFLRRFLPRAVRLERLLEAHDRDEADLQALAVVSEPRACGCQWVPCDRHLDRLWEAIHEDGEAG